MQRVRAARPGRGPGSVLGGAALLVGAVVVTLLLTAALGSGGGAGHTASAPAAHRFPLPARPIRTGRPRGGAGVAASDPSTAMVAALDDYWLDIDRHEFSAAYGYYAPGATDLTEPEFVSAEERAGVKSASFTGTVSARTGSVNVIARSFATVGVTSLLTRDAQHGCRRWSGTYTMLLEESGQWQIQHVALSPRPC
jgi:hypothetical protein